MKDESSASLASSVRHAGEIKAGHQKTSRVRTEAAALRIFAARKNEPTIAFEDLIKELNRKRDRQRGPSESHHARLQNSRA